MSSGNHIASRRLEVNVTGIADPNAWVVTDQDCPGNNLPYSQMSKPEFEFGIPDNLKNTLHGCKTLCTNEPKCLGFSRNEKTNSCQLKTVAGCIPSGAEVAVCPDEGHCFHAKPSGWMGVGADLDNPFVNVDPNVVDAEVFMKKGACPEKVSERAPDCQELDTIAEWQHLGGQQNLRIPSNQVRAYCGANDPIKSAETTRCRSPQADRKWPAVESCKSMMKNSKVCGSGLNAEFDHNSQDALVVKCGGFEAQYVGIIHANSQSGGGLGLCEVVVWRAGDPLADPPVLERMLGHRTITQKYAPIGFQGFLHFLYDCLLRVWGKARARWGANLPNLPGEHPSANKGLHKDQGFGR
jgi:hypothetical protein